MPLQKAGTSETWGETAVVSLKKKKEPGLYTSLQDRLQHFRGRCQRTGVASKTHWEFSSRKEEPRKPEMPGLRAEHSLGHGVVTRFTPSHLLSVRRFSHGSPRLLPQFWAPKMERTPPPPSCPDLRVRGSLGGRSSPANSPAPHPTGQVAIVTLLCGSVWPPALTKTGVLEGWRRQLPMSATSRMSSGS